MSEQRNRREFLRGAAFTTGGLWLSQTSWAKPLLSPNEQIQYGCIGVGGKGSSDTDDAGRNGVVAAICDVDERILAESAKKYPNAKKFTDYRKMLDEMGKSIDCVTVSTPDHNHAAAASMAMLMGKHCFCQKPLTHNISEARRLGEIARSMKVQTQMGNQGTSQEGLRRAAGWLRAGVLGTVTEVHVWTNRPIWPQGGPRNPPKPAPDNLHWDLWLGVAPTRPYADGYHTFAWRGWWDFGTGALGDMACHTVNMPYMGLDLRNPTSVVAESGGHNKDSYPHWSKIIFTFPATKTRPALKMFWYDGGKMPSMDLFRGIQKPSDSGSMIIGSKGRMYTSGDYGENARLMDDLQPMEVQYEKSPGHFEELARAIKTGKPAVSNFPDYAGPLTETILLGNLAVWAEGKTIEWDPRKLRAKNAPELESMIRPRYRPGWKVG